MNILSIDVAISKDIAYATLDDNKLGLCGKAGTIMELSVIFSFKRFDIIVMEDMYIGKNVNTLKNYVM